MGRKEIPFSVVRFAGDSGDGIQVIGKQLAASSAIFGNDVHTFPDFPAEIRAPAGTLIGVSGFQMHFASTTIHTHGDEVHVLVALNPAALKVSLVSVINKGLLILDQDSFTDRACRKAGYQVNPLTDVEKLLPGYRVIVSPITSLTLKAVVNSDLPYSKAKKCKNFFALGIVYWLFDRKLINTENWLKEKFSNKNIYNANISALRAGYNYAQTIELFSELYTVKPARLPAGTYRHITGNQAMAMGCLAAAQQFAHGTFFAGYPITPASGLLQEITKYPNFKIETFQAEDEIAAICAAIGAAYGGSLAITATSGPGFDLKSEAMGLAVMVELPLLIINVQRAGPSTGMPTKVEQADLFAARFGRHGETPIPILAAESPAACFAVFLEAAYIAIKYMTPVIILSDAYLANGSEPWQLPTSAEDIKQLPLNKPLPEIQDFQPYKRDKDTLARPWVMPGLANYEHRIGGLEKSPEYGDVSCKHEHHEQMIALRAKKISLIQKDYQPLQIHGEKDNEILAICWGCTYGATLTAVENLQAINIKISCLALRYIFPLPVELLELIASFREVIVVELNTGQLATILKAEYKCNIRSINKVSGQPLSAKELQLAIIENLNL